MKQIIAVRLDLDMPVGKIAAQVAHAAMMFVGGQMPEKLAWVHLTRKQMDWLATGMTKVVVGIENGIALRDLCDKCRDRGVMYHMVIDEGRTCFNGQPTLTCAAIGPDTPEILDNLTGHLKLLKG
jgi:peptidyl-tRNA hydrolase, PTH2 family